MGVVDLFSSGELHLVSQTAIACSVLYIAAGYASPPKDKPLKDFFLQLSVFFFFIQRRLAECALSFAVLFLLHIHTFPLRSSSAMQCSNTQWRYIKVTGGDLACSKFVLRSGLQFDFLLLFFLHKTVFFCNKPLASCEKAADTPLAYNIFI